MEVMWLAGNNMNGKHAQIKTVFTLGSDPDYKLFFNQQATTSVWIGFMAEDWIQGPWFGMFAEFSPGDSSFWDWKVSQEGLGKGVFYFYDDNGEQYAIALHRNKAELIYGLQLINGNEKIISSWE